jgi:hypothetical protein
MKKQSRGVLFVWALIAMLAAGGTLLFFGHLGAGRNREMSSVSQPDVNVQQDTDDATVAPAVLPMQTFSNDGYALSIPARWHIERTSTDTIALHSAISSSGVECKIELSAFPFFAGNDTADWISHRIGADPSLVVVEGSVENVLFAGGSGVKWIGTIDGAATTLVYAFNDHHAYEIAPSVVGGNANDSSSCADMLGTFISGLTI